MGIFTKRELRGREGREGWRPGSLIRKVTGREEKEEAKEKADIGDVFIEKATIRVEDITEKFPDAAAGTFTPGKSYFIQNVPHEYSLRKNYCSEASSVMLLNFWDVTDYNQDWFQANARIFEEAVHSQPFIEDVSSELVGEPTAEQIITSIDKLQPVMLRYINPTGGKHTVVVVGYDNEGFMVHDPDLGPYTTVTYDFFEEQKDGALFVTGSKKKSGDIGTELEADKELRKLKAKYEVGEEVQFYHFPGDPVELGTIEQKRFSPLWDTWAYLVKDKMGEVWDAIPEFQMFRLGETVGDQRTEEFGHRFKRKADTFYKGFIEGAIEPPFKIVMDGKDYEIFDDRYDALFTFEKLVGDHPDKRIELHGAKGFFYGKNLESEGDRYADSEGKKKIVDKMFEETSLTRLALERRVDILIEEYEKGSSREEAFKRMFDETNLNEVAINKWLDLFEANLYKFGEPEGDRCPPEKEGDAAYTFTKPKKSGIDDEWVVRAWKDGKRYPEADYFTDDKDDAWDTYKAQLKWAEEHKADAVMVSKPVWEYNRFGHVTLTFPDESNVYFQSESDVEAFFERIGMDMEDVGPGDWDEVEWDLVNEYQALAEEPDAIKRTQLPKSAQKKVSKLPKHIQPLVLKHSEQWMKGLAEYIATSPDEAEAITKKQTEEIFKIFSEKLSDEEFIDVSINWAKGMRKRFGKGFGKKKQ